MRVSLVVVAIVLFTAAIGVAGRQYHAYRDLALGFELRYPAAGMVRELGPNTVQIDLPVVPGTTLIEEYLLIEPAAPGDRSGDGVEVGGINLWFEHGNEGAAGSIYDYVRCIGTLADGQRFALTFVLRFANRGAFDSPPPPFDRAREALTFWRIIASLRSLQSGLNTRPQPGNWCSSG